MPPATRAPSAYTNTPTSRAIARCWWDLAALDLIRQWLDRYLDGLAGYGLPGNLTFDDAAAKPTRDPPFLDSYPSLLIAAADYVAGSGDLAWLGKQYPRLKDWGDKLLAMDSDGNGLLDYPYSGNSGSWSGKAQPPLQLVGHHRLRP